MLYIFDMGGVVTNTSKIEPLMCEKLGISIEEFNKICKKNTGGEDLLAAFSDGKIGTKEFWKEFEIRSGIKAKTDWFHFLFHPVTNFKTVEIVKQLREKGNRVICGTNTNESYYMNHIERGDYSFFDQTYASNFLGVSKPDADFFMLIMELENVLPKDCVFIDDRKENVDSACSLGIKGIVFESAEKLKLKLGL